MAEEEAPAEEAAVPTICKPEILSFCLVGKVILAQQALEADPIMVNLGSEKRGFTLLQVATIASRNSDAVIDMLIAAGADLKTTDKIGQTAFHTAADKDNEGPMVKLLSLPGAQEVMDIADEDGCTALHYAAWGGKVGTVTALLRAGANKEVANNDGRTPSGEAEHKGHQKIVDLIANGPPPEESEEQEAPAE